MNVTTDGRLPLAMDGNLRMALDALFRELARELNRTVRRSYLGQVAGEAALLALTSAERGDFAHRLDTNTVWELIGDDPTSILDWLECIYPGTDAFQSAANANRVLLTGTSQSVPTGSSWTDLNLTTTTTNTGTSAFTIDLTANTLTCTRAGTYNLAAMVHYDDDSGTNLDTMELRILLNGSAISGSTVSATHYTNAANTSHNGCAPNYRTPNNISLSVGDVVKAQTKHSNASSVNTVTCWLGAFEIFTEGYDLQRFDYNYIWWTFPEDTPTVTITTGTSAGTYDVDDIVPECSTSTSWQFPGETFTATTLAAQQFEATPFRRPQRATFQLVENHTAAGTTEVQLWAMSQEFGVSSNVIDTAPTRKLIKTMSVNDSGRTNNSFSFTTGEIDDLMSIASRFGLAFHLRYRSADGVGKTMLISPRLLFFYR